jgi:hypothetical protein
MNKLPAGLEALLFDPDFEHWKYLTIESVVKILELNGLESSDVEEMDREKLARLFDPKDVARYLVDSLSKEKRPLDFDEVGNKSGVQPMKSDKLDPPKIAEFLLIAFATTRYAAHVVGDRNEVFARECKELGRDRAVKRYWANTLRSLWPLLTRAIERALKWGYVIAALRRLF